MYNGKQIYFDHDFSPELQKKRALVRDVVKQLKLKNIGAKCIFPAQLRVSKDGGVKTNSSLTDAAPELEEMGVHVRVDEREQLETELSRAGWSTAGRRARRAPVTLSHVEIKTFFTSEG